MISRRITRSALSALFLMLAYAGSAQFSAATYYPGEVWLRLDPEVSKTIESEGRVVELNDLLAVLNRDRLDEFEPTLAVKPFYFAEIDDLRSTFELHFDAVNRTDELIAVLQRMPGVKLVERIPVMRPTLEPNDLGPASGNGNQYGLWIIDAPSAWDINTGSAEVQVAVVDDAVLTTHQDLIPNLVPGFDVADDDADPMPNEPNMSHGTHVAGIIGAATNNGEGIASVGFNIKIIPVKSSNQAQVVTDAYAGVIWAAENGADVINMSWGGSGFSQTGQDIITYAFEQGCINVAAAGNDDTDQVFYPAGYDHVISVASTTSTDQKSGFSNYGAWVDIAAPGSQILSTYIGGGFAPTYASQSGTSMASPMVAGLAGLVLSVNTEMSQLQVENCILNTADNIDALNPGFLGELGAGRINAFEAVLCAQATVNAPPVAVISAEPSVACPGGLIQFFGSSAGGLATEYNWSFPGGIPATSTAQNPIVSYPAPGNYDVSLTVNNDFGDDETTVVNFVEISSNGVDVFFTEDFEFGTLQSNGWVIDNPDNGITWSLSEVAGTVSGATSVGINLFNDNSVGARDGLHTPVLDFSNHFNVQLDFQHAHRRLSSNFSDSLIVAVSTDGGATFPDRLLAVAEDGSGSFATGSIANAEFIPQNGGDWCFGGEIGSGCFTVDLSDYDGAQNVVVRFESYNDGGNNIYLDNIQLSGNCVLVQAAPQAAFDGLPNTLCSGETVQFTDESLNIPTEYLWEFEGGTPATSNLAAPEVSYAAPGSYDVALTVTNPFGTDQVTVQNYVVVSEAPVLAVNTNAVEICEGESVALFASGAVSYSWSPDIGLSGTTDSAVEASPTGSITYTVTGSTGGCSISETIDVDVLPAPPEPELVAQNDVTFAVLQPSDVSGYYGYTSTSTANGWGNPNIGTLSVEAPLVMGSDGSAGDSLLCNPAQNAGELAGTIAVAYRGGCEFGTKALNAQIAGAVGIVIVNNVTGAPIEMGPGDDGAAVNIPAIQVSDVTGGIINSAINAGDAVGVIGQFNGGGFTICPGTTMRLAAPGGLAGYDWTSGDSHGVIEISEPGTYALEVANANNCTASSPTVVVDWYDVSIPVIASDGQGNLVVNNPGGSAYQWFLNGEPIPGGSDGILPNVQNGVYTVQITDQNGCLAESEPFEVLSVSVEELEEEIGLHVFPVPANDGVTIVLNGVSNVEALAVYNLAGQRVTDAEREWPVNSDRMFIDTSEWASGIYIAEMRALGKTYRSRIVITR